MPDMILDCALDALKDGALSIPVLFVAYLLMELLERSKRLDENILHAYSRKAGPAVGGLLRVVPHSCMKAVKPHLPPKKYPRYKNHWCVSPTCRRRMRCCVLTGARLHVRSGGGICSSFAK